MHPQDLVLRLPRALGPSCVDVVIFNLSSFAEVRSYYKIKVLIATSSPTSHIPLSKVSC